MVGAVIVAAGKGLRMRAETPKQYMALAGLPVLCHTLRRIAAAETVDSIALVVPESDHDYCRRHILAVAGIDRPVLMVSGGPRRQDSVRNGLAAIGDGERRDLYELLDDRHERRSTIVTSQLPVEEWHRVIADPSLADAILDRLTSNAYRIELDGPSIRPKRLAWPHPTAEVTPQ